MSVFRCPVCGDVMKFNTPTLCSCRSCQIYVEIKSMKVTIGEMAPRHIKESAEFLDICRNTQPKFVISDYKLFSKDFRLDNCIFIAPKHNDPNINIGKSMAVIDMRYKHLIAAGNTYSYMLLDTFICGVRLGFDISPICNDEYNGKDYMMWLYTQIASCNVARTEFMRRLINSYFSPTLEGAIKRVYNILPTCSLIDVTDESALYAIALSGVALNIGWGSGVENMYKLIKEYIKACLKDVSKLSVPYSLTPDLSRSPMLNSPMGSEFQKSFYNSMPSTAVNLDAHSLCSFDIMNHEFQLNCFSHLDKDIISDTEVMALSSSYRFLGSLWDRYESGHKQLGFEMKKKYLNNPDHNTSDELVLQFWKEMEKELNNEKA